MIVSAHPRLLGSMVVAGMLAGTMLSLVATTVQPAAAAVAPNGQIAYAYNDDIWVMNADGTGDTNITNTPRRQRG